MENFSYEAFSISKNIGKHPEHQCSSIPLAEGHHCADILDTTYFIKLVT